MSTRARAKTTTVASWNVNGLRAAATKGFPEWLAGTSADVVCLQEVRALPSQLPESLVNPPGWHARFAPAERKGYSGVATLSRRAPEVATVGLGIPDFDVEGRLLTTRHGALTVVNGYFPNGNGKERDNSRIPYKLDFYRAVFDALAPAFERGEPIVVVGDFNTAHRPIDLARPKTNEQTSGFTAEEREELDRWLRAGWVDSFRTLCAEPDRYTWWSARFGVREKNVGWRIDYALLSPGAARHLVDATIEASVLGSDHCPITVTLDRAVLSSEVP
ncbi:MAG: exodeoxyribonuclease III [Myxococcales bacterium]|nr:exodeoxyribonuclease III [Myxococcales bacterium]MCB9531887.1 exodeoxyribonuclease III [Myxococcales bacterium]MCB9533995.1 exodeoxyribonuclease III [Myxococcales bacterium]